MPGVFAAHDGDSKDNANAAELRWAYVVASDEYVLCDRQTDAAGKHSSTFIACVVKGSGYSWGIYSDGELIGMLGGLIEAIKAADKRFRLPSTSVPESPPATARRVIGGKV